MGCIIMTTGKSDRLFAPLPPPPESTRTNSPVYDFSGKCGVYSAIFVVAVLTPRELNKIIIFSYYFNTVSNQEHLQGESDRMFAPLPTPPEPSVTDSSAYANIPGITSGVQSINGASLKEHWAAQHYLHGSNSSTT